MGRNEGEMIDLIRNNIIPFLKSPKDILNVLLVRLIKFISKVTGEDIEWYQNESWYPELKIYLKENSF